MALKLEQDKEVKGISIYKHDNTIKIKQFADDTTIFARDIIDFREILSRIKQFGEISGLILNQDKSKILLFNEDKEYEEDIEKEGFNVVKEIKILGIIFSSIKTFNEIPKNWEGKIKKVEGIFKAWTKRNLSILGKIQIVKTFELSQFIYLLQSFNLPEEALNKINSIFFKFIWKRKFTNKKAFEKIKRKVMCSQLNRGGLNMIDIKIVQSAFLLQWAESYLISDDKGNGHKHNFYQAIGNKAALMGVIDKVSQFKGINLIESLFWKKVLETWYTWQRNTESIKEFTINETFMNNKHFKVGGNSIFLPSLIKSNVIYVKDIHTGDRLISLDEFKKKLGNNYTPRQRMIIDYTIVKNAMAGKKINMDERTENQQIFFKGEIVGKLKMKGFKKLISPSTTSHAVDFWRRKFHSNCLENHWEIAVKCTREIRLIALHWKIMSNIYPTNILLKKMGIRNNSICETCKEEDYIEHFFFRCKDIKKTVDRNRKEITS